MIWLTKLVSIALTAGVVVAPSYGQGAIVPSDPSRFHLFLLAGQSNMAGRGKIDQESRRAHERVLTLDKSGEWVAAVDPLHFDKPKIVGVGLGKTFAEDYADRYPEVTVGLIPCAVGGSPIDAWRPGGHHRSTNTHPYDDAIARVKLAMKSGVLKGILWHQGESDAKPALAAEYEQNLHALIARFRDQLNSPSVPFIAGQMGKFPERPWDEDRKRVDAVHQRLPSSVAATGFVVSDGLSHKGDFAHFDTSSYRTLGHRYFEAYRSLVEPEDTALRYEVQRTVAHRGFDGKMCWVHARAGVIPVGAGSQKSPQVVMTTQRLQLSGSDVFYALHQTASEDGGATWSEPSRLDSFARQQMADGREVTVCDFTPRWHQKTGKLLGTGQTVWYQDNRVMHVRPRATAYAVYDHGAGEWSDWKRLKMPDDAKFRNAGAGSVQRFDLASGDVLLPIYFKEPEQRQYSTTVCRCSFDGKTLKYVEHGNSLTVDVKRGLYEPSITRFGGRFYLTMRNDDHGYVAVSDDGLVFGDPIQWTFDDGSDLGNYNTQQHWVTHRDGLFLVYTRRGLENDHVFRHRAPLMIAQVDPQQLQVIRSSEQVLVPENGARLGNFGVVDISPDETWVTVTEWMQPVGVEKYGSDNRIHVAKLKWNRPNRSVTP